MRAAMSGKLNRSYISAVNKSEVKSDLLPEGPALSIQCRAFLMVPDLLLFRMSLQRFNLFSVSPDPLKVVEQPIFLVKNVNDHVVEI